MQSSTIAPVDIKAAYWCLFGRLPESDAVIKSKSALSLDAITRELILSEEFARRIDRIDHSHGPYIDSFSLDNKTLEDIRASEYIRYLGQSPESIQSNANLQLLRTLESDRLVEVFAQTDRAEVRARLCSRVYDCVHVEANFRSETVQLQRLADHEDITMAYAVFLGRRPESETAIEAKLGLLLVELILSLLASSEFHDEICVPLLNQELVIGHRFWQITDARTISWCVSSGLIDSNVSAEIVCARVIFTKVMKSPLIYAIHSRGKLAWPIDKLLLSLDVADDGLATHQLLSGRPTHVYGRSHLQLMLNRVTDLIEVVVDKQAPRRVNVLVPAFDFKSMSAGFFGVFQISKFIRSCGYNVRLVMFDNFYWNEVEFREKLLGYPGMENLFDELEVEYVGDRKTPLVVSPDDGSVATVWYSAYLAEKISSLTNNLPFLYLIQDYETNFYSGSSHFSLADATYLMNYSAIFSSSSLRDFFIINRVGAFDGSAPHSIYFNNASASFLPDIDDFLGRRGPSRLAFYSRPVVHRNMFELGALALIEAFKDGIFDGEEWEFLGVGLGDASIQLSGSRKMRQLDRMNLREYSRVISTFDVGLCLMASPHPSLLPFDLGGSGAIVVTNTFMNKSQGYFDKLCENVIAKPPTLSGVVEGIAEAVERSRDRSKRYSCAAKSLYPTSWDNAFSQDHRKFVKAVFN